MQQIDHEGAPPDGADPRQADIRHGGGFRPQAVEIKPCPEEKQPRQQGKVVRGDEAGGGEAQPGGERVCIPVPGQIQKRDAGMAEKALVHIPQHQKQGKAQGQPRTGRDAGQQRPERDGQQGGRSQKGQHTELHQRAAAETE